MGYDILVVDDEADIREVIKDLLEDEGYSVRTAADGPSAVEQINNRRPSLVILDIWLGDSRFDGMKVLDVLCRDHPNVPAIMMSGHGNIQTAVAAIKQGAYDFMEKPFKSDRLLLVIKRAIESARLKQQNQEMRSQIVTEDSLIGNSAFVSQMHQTIQKVGPTNSRVLITGPSGSGKEHIAKMLHEHSPRGETGPFVVANCQTINVERFEEEFFGVEKSTIDDVIYSVGLLEQAHLGTLFLHEITEMPLEMQGRFVRMLQDSSFTRVNGCNKIEVDVRIVASSTRDMSMAIQEGRFREDLFYRLNVMPIAVKPLCERKEDIIVLAKYFLENAFQQIGSQFRNFSEDAVSALQGYGWPGNIRQLRNVIDWIVIMSDLSDTSEITAEMLPPEITPNLPNAPHMDGSQEILRMPLREAREMFEKQYLLSQVARFSGNISQTASFVGMERSALHRKLRSLGVGTRKY